MNRLLILSEDAEKYHELIIAADLPQLEVVLVTDPEPAAEVVAGCNIIFGEPGRVSSVLEAAHQLEWVQSSWAGVNSLCTPGSRRDYVLTGVKDIFGPRISEYVLTYLFALERRIFTMRDNQKDRLWKPLPYRSSDEIKLGVVGLGSIGQHLAHSAGQFGIRVTGLSRSGTPCAEVEKVYTVENLADFLKDLDYIAITLPDTPQTKHFINTDVLKMMKPTATLINVGRGSVINEPDLIGALESGVIGAAVLDVFTNEPLTPDSPLWQLPNAYITPHHAAITFPDDIVPVFIQNYRRFLQQAPLLHVVDFELGY
jgi:phosphoglycerate dehydrogenase-like enzyme